MNETRKKNPIVAFFLDVLAGFAMGIAFIIPGFSGGSVAAIVGIYEKLIGAVADIFRDFKRSFITLLPIGFGLVMGAVTLLYPIKFFLGLFPLPTVSLFVGLALGGMFTITNKITSRPTIPNYFSFLIPFIGALLLSFAPTGADLNLFSFNAGGYILLFLIGIIASAALVIPGISGSMLLLIIGLYNPLITIITDHFLKGKDMLVSTLILGSMGLGIIVGFIGISVIMKFLLNKYPRGTYIAIIGFIIGSIPTTFISTSKEAGFTITTLPTHPVHWIACVVMLLGGFALTFFFARYAIRREAAGDTANSEVFDAITTSNTPEEPWEDPVSSNTETISEEKKTDEQVIDGNNN